MTRGMVKDKAIRNSEFSGKGVTGRQIAERPNRKFRMMRTQALAMLLAFSVVGCATGPSISSPTYRTAPDLPSPAARAGGWAVSVVGTPFFLVFKTAVCTASLAVAAPISALIALSGEPDKEVFRQGLSEAVGKNCGPPYIL